ncbi:MAG TPA: hypothetical protein VJX67_21730 [Blastocatellia bacterium]|nr:hypothetical protein [Blastocatellia bacterium]
MSTLSKNLWPDDIAAVSTVTPLGILKRQAAALGEQTKNIVEARVRTDPIVGVVGRYPPSRVAAPGGGSLSHIFQLVAPALANYTYALFTARHPAVDLYPCTIDFDGKSYDAGSSEELERILSTVFSSEKTRRIVGSLLSQSQDAGPPPKERTDDDDDLR